MADSVDLSELQAEMTDVAIDQRGTLLEQLLVDKLPFTSFMEVLTGVRDKLPLHQIFVDEILQPGAKDSFTAKEGAIKFKPRMAQVMPCKVDLEFAASKINAMYKTYQGQITAKVFKANELPFAQYLFMRIVKRAKQDLHLKAIFKGEHNAGGTAAKDVMDGLLAKIATAVAAGDIPEDNLSMLPNGGLTSANTYDEVTKVFKKINEEYWDLDLKCIVSPGVKYMYQESYQTIYSATPWNDKFEQHMLPGTNTEIIADPGLSATDEIIITPKSNLFYIVGDIGNMNDIEVEKAKRVLSVMMDFEVTVDFGVGDYIWKSTPYVAP